MKLYGYMTTPFVRKAIYALKCKDLTYEHDEIVPFTERERILKLNPEGKVPVLEMDGKLIPDSTAICLALDAAYPDRTRLYPVDPAELQAAHDMVKWAESTFLQPVGFGLMYPLVIAPYDMKREISKDDVPATIAKVEELFTEVESKLPATGFVTGGALCVADVTLLGWVRVAELCGCRIDAASLPKLAAWKERVLADEVVSKVDKMYLEGRAMKEALANGM